MCCVYMDRRLVETTKTVAVIVDVSWRFTSVITMKHPNWWEDVGKLEHGPYKTASDTLASRFVASDKLDVTWTSLDCRQNAPYTVLKLTRGSRDCRKTSSPADRRSAERFTAVDVDRRVGENYQLCYMFGCIDCMCVAVKIV